MSELIMVCKHVAQGQPPDVVLMESGNVQSAACHPCAEQINSGSKCSNAVAETLTMLCTEHSGAILQLAAEFTSDGFWIHHPDGWSHQPEESAA